MPPSKVTEDAFSAFQVRVVVCPLLIKDGDADRAIVGVGGGGGGAGLAGSTFAIGGGVTFFAQLELKSTTKAKTARLKMLKPIFLKGASFVRFLTLLLSVSTCVLPIAIS